ncbi:UDP-glucose 4-epimerase GalE [Kribbella sp. NPDC050124]|uniref:UDP-glucose 4-epimerase GalE n=1 Tax=Kribbella sp. NPDC050124 TaxID=3364114 RepID=UPI003792635B
MSWLVTGGAGYIGAHVVRELQHANDNIVVVDDLSAGHRTRLDRSVPFVAGSVHDTSQLVRVMAAHNVEGVVHLAGHKGVAESTRHPLDYYRHNVHGLHSVLTAMLRGGVRRILFSSSAAVYGPVTPSPVTESAVTQPASPYGSTKLAAEHLLRDAAAAHGVDWAVLRYFNVGGAAAPALADTGADNLIPRLLDAAETGDAVAVNGIDHPTRDGTCVRDYVHVADVAHAHRYVLDQLRNGPLATIYNVGSGIGASVLEVIDAVRRATGRPVPWRATEPRVGDAAEVVANPAKIRTELGWSAVHDLDDITRSAWAARATGRARTPHGGRVT